MEASISLTETYMEAAEVSSVGEVVNSIKVMTASAEVMEATPWKWWKSNGNNGSITPTKNGCTRPLEAGGSGTKAQARVGALCDNARSPKFRVRWTRDEGTVKTHS